MKTTSELLALLTILQPRAAPEVMWNDLAEAEPILPHLSIEDKEKVVTLLHQHLKDTTNPKHVQILQHILSKSLVAALPNADDINYEEVFNQKGFKAQLQAIKAIDQRNTQEAERLAREVNHGNEKLSKMTQGTEEYIAAVSKQLKLVQEQLQSEVQHTQEVRKQIQLLEQDIAKQDEDMKQLHQKKLQYDENIRKIEEEYKQRGNSKSSPLETQLKRRIASLEQNLFETTELLKKSNVDAKHVNAIVGVEHITVSKLKIIIENLTQELKKTETTSENWKKQYQEVQSQLTNLHLKQLDITESSNNTLQQSVKTSKMEADTIRGMYNNKVSQYNDLIQKNEKLKTELERINLQQEANLIQLRQELESTRAESAYHKERFERMQSNESERLNHMRVGLEAEFRTKHEKAMVKLNNEVENLRRSKNDAVQDLAHKEALIRAKETEMKNMKDAMNDQRQLDRISITKLTERMHAMEKDITNARRKLEEYQDAVKTKESELEAVAQQAKFHDAIIEGIRSKAKSEVETYRKKASDASAQSQRMMQERDQASAEMSKLRAQVENLRSNLLVSTKTGLTCDQQIAALEKKSADELKHVNTKLSSVQTNYNALRKKLAESELVHKHADRIKQDLTTEKEKVSQYLAEIKELKNTISTLQVSTTQSKSEKASMQELLKKCSTAQKEAHLEQDKLDRRIQDLMKLHDEEKRNMNSLVAQHTQSITQQEITIKELQQKIVDLTNRLRDTDDARNQDKNECRQEMRKHIQAKESAIKALVDMQR
jgi:chromosome segregation ATPase